MASLFTTNPQVPGCKPTRPVTQKNMVERTVQGDPQKWDVNHALTQERDQHDPPQNPPDVRTLKKSTELNAGLFFNP